MNSDVTNSIRIHNYNTGVDVILVTRGFMTVLNIGHKIRKKGVMFREKE